MRMMLFPVIYAKCTKFNWHLMSNCLFKSSRVDGDIPRFFVFTITLRQNQCGFKIWKKGNHITKKQVKLYTLHLSSRCFHSPQSHRYLCSWGFVHLPPRCNSKSIRYTCYLSSCLFVGYIHSPRSHSYLCSRGFAPLPSRCILKSIGYMIIKGKIEMIKVFLSE
ncbi:hypothetical protein BDD30_2152 [Photorhabdus asymbiotica]|uniref:Uncharacterized protein n=1 Tax=Photorhabdus asymbiotica TaxID=291112 RepID=A0ABX9SPS8_9GAMM|nr:hypothetical protein BDD30_2152 [Photorhabdus asymbiotica]